MKTKRFLIICAALIACVVFVDARSYGRRPVHRRAKWGYKVLGANPDEKQLNDRGAEGWEIAGVGPDGRVYLKQPR